MADSFGKKEREKKKAQKRKEKQMRKKELKDSGVKAPEFVYLGPDGQLTTEKPNLFGKEEISLEEISISTPKKEDLEPEDLTKIGILKYFNTEKGYGFINEKDSSESYFVHINNMTGEISQGEKVSFTVEKGPKGLIAVEVKVYKP